MQMKLMLVDDHPLFLDGLQYLLGTHGIDVAGTAKNGREAIEKARTLRPDIILMDIRMPECDGMDALKLIKAELPDIKIIMLTTSEEDEDIFEAIKSGASGYLLKNINAKELIEILSDIENDCITLSPNLASRLLKEFKHKKVERYKPEQDITQELKMEILTGRHLEILEMVAKGVTYKEAGETLGLTERTIKYHMGRILELLHLENRAQLIAYAVRVGIVENDLKKHC